MLTSAGRGNVSSVSQVAFDDWNALVGLFRYTEVRGSCRAAKMALQLCP
jgi:hypothetical protein